MELIDHVMYLVREKISMLQLSSRVVVATYWAKNSGFSVATDALLKFDDNHKTSIKSKSQLKSMRCSRRFFNGTQHYRERQFYFELRLCGKIDCSLCNRVGRNGRVPNATAENFNFREEVLRRKDLPVPNTTDKNHCLSPTKAKKAIEKIINLCKIFSHVSLLRKIIEKRWSR